MGGVAERTNALVLKTSRLERVSEVRILSPPPDYYFLFCFKSMAFQKIFLDTSEEDEEVDSSVIDLRSKKIEEEPEEEDTEPEDVKGSGKTLLSWQAPEFEKYEKGKDWFLVFGIVIVVLVVVSLIARAFLPAITFIMLGAVIFIFSQKSPRDIRFSIRRDGVLINNKLYEWSTLASFWIFYKRGELKVLSLRSKKPLMPYIHLPLGDQNPVHLRRVMTKYLPEEEQEESAIDGMARRLRF